MPATYNGIGTTYYGMKNTVSRNGACVRCHRQGVLESYDTKLWFVIFFIPVIPLGRKRIVDRCKYCTAHMVVDAHKWETAKQLEVSGAQEQFRTEPTAENAIAVHQQLLNFHQHAEAAAFRETMKAQFGGHAKVQAYLGVILERLGQVAEAQAYYQRAHELRPDLTEARVGLASEHLRQGRLDEARQLLDYLQRPGAGQLYPLQPIEVLASAYQKAGRHTEALELFGRLSAELPRINEHKAFRKAVKASEKALGRTTSILPGMKFNWRRLVGLQESVDGSHRGRRILALLGAVGLVVLVGVPLRMAWMRKHRTLHMVNAFRTPAQIELQGQPAFEAPPGHSTHILPEGTYHASVRGPVTEEVDFAIGEEFGNGGGHPVWILNVGGAAVLELQEVVYSRDPEPGSSSLHFGESFVSFPEVNRPFMELPQSVTLHNGESRRTLTGLTVIDAPVASIASHLARQGNAETALRFCEQHLRLEPDKAELVHLYLSFSAQHSALPRATEFLRQGLTNRPVAVEWHRAYQETQKYLAPSGMVSLYDGFLQTEPNNSRLLYLRARVEPVTERAQALFQQAREADPKNPYPWFALGWRQHSLGNWQAARTNFARVIELAPEGPGFRHYFDETRLALGEGAAVESEARAELKKHTDEVYEYASRLLEALATQGRIQEGKAAVGLAGVELRNSPPQVNQGVILPLEYKRLYLAAEFAELEKAARSSHTMLATNAVFYALIEQGKVREATAIYPLEDPANQEPLHMLTVALAWREAGNLKEAMRWQNKAQTFFARDPEKARVAEFLLGARVTLEAVTAVQLSAKERMLVLVTLAWIHPDQAAEFKALARRLNVDRDYPYHLVQRMTAPVAAAAATARSAP